MKYNKIEDKQVLNVHLPGAMKEAIIKAIQTPEEQARYQTASGFIREAIQEKLAKLI